MLSILLPIYNYNVYPLAKQIVEQCLKLDIVFELICVDDGSNSSLNKENKKINALLNSKFISKKQNEGLSSNRNLLASLSNYEFLLFIDGDSELSNTEFIETYTRAIQEDTEIIYGGRIHPAKVENPIKKLRWKYGVHIEDKTAAFRNKNIYKTLLFNNTLIKKQCFNGILFDPSLKKYGHEDTLFAYQTYLKIKRATHQ